MLVDSERSLRLTKKAEPRRISDVDRDSGTEMANIHINPAVATA